MWARLIKAHQDGVSYKRMESVFGIKKDTAYRICSGRQFATKPRGGTKANKIDEKFLVSTVELPRSDSLVQTVSGSQKYSDFRISSSRPEIIFLNFMEIVFGLRRCLDQSGPWVTCS